MARITRINHIGLAVPDDEAARFWQALGLPQAGSEAVPAEAVNVAFFPAGESRLELLQPLGAEGPVQKFLTNRGEGVHHICFEVDDIRGLLAQLAAAGVELVNAGAAARRRGQPRRLHPPPRRARRADRAAPGRAAAGDRPRWLTPTTTRPAPAPGRSPTAPTCACPSCSICNRRSACPPCTTRCCSSSRSRRRNCGSSN